MDRTQKNQPVAMFWALAALCPCSFALNPSLDINQHGHTAWTIRDGFFKGRIYSMTQTGDGYLMLGTEFGLVRFDGIRSVDWAPSSGRRLPSNNIRSLLTSRDGTLWIGTLEGLASWKDGTLTHYPEVAGQHVYTLIEDREGTVWAGTFALPAAKLCEIRRGKARCYGEDGSLGQWVESLYQDSAGRVWAGAATGLWRWKPGPPQRYVLPHPIDTGQGIVDDEDRSGLIAIADRLFHMENGKIVEYRLPGVRWPFNPLNMLRDRDGGLWMGTLEHGLLHVYRGKTDVFSPRDGLSGDRVRCLFEDREGNIWVATGDGLDRFRALSVSSVSMKQGLSSPSAMSVLVDHEGAVWSGTADGLNKWKDGRITIYRAPGRLQRTAPLNGEAVDARVREIIDPGLADNQVGSLFEDDRGRLWVSTVGGISRFENGRFTRVREAPDGWVNGITRDFGGGVWIAYEDRGLYHLVEDQVAARLPWDKLGPGVASSMIPDPIRKRLWLGFFKGGVVYFDGAQVRAAYGTKDGLGAGRVMGLQLDTDGVLWAATEGGLSRIKDGRVSNLSSANGLPCDAVHWMVEDKAHFFWLYSPCGMVRISRMELEAWAAQPNRTIQRTVFDASDGVRLVALLTGYTPRVSQSADGKIWFAHLDSISVIDPRHLLSNDLPPPVHVEEMTADRKIYWQNSPGDSSGKLRRAPLPPLSRDVVIDYTALSLIAPEKDRFKYKLEGYDRDWQDAGSRRQAVYSNLPPRSYRFRVIASNNSGVWNEAGDTLEFGIAPAYYQTTWFRAAGIAAFLAALWGLYRLRLYQVNREFHAQLEGRVDERLRLARDLHDTLLQSFQGLMPVFQTARNLLPGQSDRAAEVLDEGLHDAAGAIVEGRSAIENLRAKPSLDPDLGSLLNAAGQELAQSPEAEGSTPAFRVVVEGSRQTLAPLLQDEIYRIGREMLRNAFRHAHAGGIEVEIRYDRDTFRLRIRDDGKGIDSSVLREGARTGHWGLPGMHERAKRIGGRLKIWSEPGAGTEAELTVPARIAYKKFSTSNRWWARLGRRLRLTAPNREA